MKKVFIVHKWGGAPESDWYPWLKATLEKNGIQTNIPEMPNTNAPGIEDWVPFLADAIGRPDSDTYLVGHSMGSQAILRYLEGLNDSEMVGGVLFVAGYVTLKPESLDDDGKSIQKPWLETPIDMQKVRKRCKAFVSIFSDNDPYVGLDNARIFEEGLGSRTIIIPKAGHLTEKSGYKELHVALNELLKMMK